MTTDYEIWQEWQSFYEPENYEDTVNDLMSRGVPFEAADRVAKIYTEVDPIRPRTEEEEAFVREITRCVTTVFLPENDPWVALLNELFPENNFDDCEDE